MEDMPSLDTRNSTKPVPRRFSDNRPSDIEHLSTCESSVFFIRSATLQQRGFKKMTSDYEFPKGKTVTAFVGSLQLFQIITVGPNKKRCLIGITRPTLHIFINFSSTKKQKQNPETHVCAGGYHHWCLRLNHFQTSNQKSVLKNK